MLNRKIMVKLILMRTHLYFFGNLYMHAINFFTLAMMYSAAMSSGLSFVPRLSFLATSFNEIREYASEIRRIAVLITL